MCAVYLLVYITPVQPGPYTCARIYYIYCVYLGVHYTRLCVYYTFTMYVLPVSVYITTVECAFFLFLYISHLYNVSSTCSVDKHTHAVNLLPVSV